MKKFATLDLKLFRIVFLILTYFFLSQKSFAEESSVKNPFFLPQTHFFLGSVSRTVTFSKGGVSSSIPFQAQKINIYGFDLERNATPYLNIGAFFSTEYQSGRHVDKFTILLGAFTRFFYSPSFLQTKSFVSQVFFRIDLGVGPYVIKPSLGMLSQVGLSVGYEAYFNPWFGLGVSYGKVFEYGQDTGSSPRWDRTITSTGKVILVYLKTTFL